MLLITPGGLDAIGVEREAKQVASGGDQFNAGANASGSPVCSPTAVAGAAPASSAVKEPAAPSAPRTGRSATRMAKTSEGTKQAQLVAMLRSSEGATVADLVAATGWQPHTVRGAFAGALKKRLGLAVASEKVDGRGRVYRIAD